MVQPGGDVWAGWDDLELGMCGLDSGARVLANISCIQSGRKEQHITPSTIWPTTTFWATYFGHVAHVMVFACFK